MLGTFDQNPTVNGLRKGGTGSRLIFELLEADNHNQVSI
jgi:hypothetical protein